MEYVTDNVTIVMWIIKVKRPNIRLKLSSEAIRPSEYCYTWFHEAVWKLFLHVTAMLLEVENDFAQ